MHPIRVIAAILLSCSITFGVGAEYRLQYDASFVSNTGSGDFAPSYMSANIHGTLTQPKSSLMRASLSHDMDMKSRFSYGFGVDIIGGFTSSTGYSLYDVTNNTYKERDASPSAMWIQQLYGELKYHGAFLTLGMKEWNSALLNQQLSSGDISFSGNTHPIPGVMVGLVDFQDIPLTNGCVQINGKLEYGKTMDDKWMENRYNYYNYFITTGYVFNYKNIYFRTNPSKPFSFTIGMQASCQIGGTANYYEGGILKSQTKVSVGLKELFRALIPGSGGESGGDKTYYEGNHVGSWDIMGRYLFHNGTELKAYYQSPWEDGSGIGKLNGFDGLYGIEYKSATQGLIDGAVMEYIDFTNQSGPIHWAPDDHKNSHITSSATGSDEYYNNYFYNGYQYYGMALGTPLAKSVIYNTDGYLRFTDNRIRGFHFAATGHISAPLQYRLMVGYRTSWGTPFIPNIERKHNTSWMLEGVYTLPRLNALQLKGQVAMDRGTLMGNNFGVLVSVSYRGLLKF